MCGCTSNFVNKTGTLPLNIENAQIGLTGLPYQLHMKSYLTNSEIEQKCWDSSNDPDEILACIEREKKLRNQSYWQQGLNWLGELFGPNDSQQGPNPPPSAPPADKKTSPWVYVGVIAAVGVIGFIAYKAISSPKVKTA